MVEKKVEEVEEEIKVSKDVAENENSQMIWFFVVVGIVFAAVLVPYFWTESSKSFEFNGIDWVIESYAEPTGDIFHGRFLSFVDESLYYNVFLREDPRSNDVYTEGTFDSFKYGGYVSWDQEVEGCRGELSRVMLDLADFLKRGVGVGEISSAASEMDYANDSGMEYVTCDTLNRTVVIIDIGEESKVIQNKENPNCYTVYATSCDDLTSVEKFIVKSIKDFKDSYSK